MAFRDELLTPPPDAKALERVRAKVKASRPASFNWRRDVRAMLVGTLGVTALAAAGTGVGHQWVDGVRSRLPLLALLLGTQIVSAWAAFAPGAKNARRVALALAALSMVAIVALRGAGAAGSLPQWFCTVSHLSVAILPLLFTLVLLRHAALSPLRVLVGGLGVGTIGAMLGELACGQGPTHVLLYHVPAWVLVSAACVLLSRKLRPRSFAP